MASSWVTATLISLMAVQVWTHTSSGRVFFYSKHSPSRAVTLLISAILIDVWQKFKAASICISLMNKILNMPLHVSGSFCSLSTKNNSSFVFITQPPLLCNHKGVITKSTVVYSTEKIYFHRTKVKIGCRKMILLVQCYADHRCSSPDLCSLISGVFWSSVSCWGLGKQMLWWIVYFLI